jgi:hypothetical protein
MRGGLGPVIGERTMENYRPRNEALLKVMAEEPAYVVIEDGGRHYRARRSPVAKACEHLPYIYRIFCS